MASGIIGGRVTATARSSTPEPFTGSGAGAVETEVTLQIS